MFAVGPMPKMLSMRPRHTPRTKCGMAFMRKKPARKSSTVIELKDREATLGSTSLAGKHDALSHAYRLLPLGRCPTHLRRSKL